MSFMKNPLKLLPEGSVLEREVNEAAPFLEPESLYSASQFSTSSPPATSSTTPSVGPPDTPVAPTLSSFADHGQEDEAAGEIIEMANEENAKELIDLVFVILFEIKRGRRG